MASGDETPTGAGAAEGERLARWSEAVRQSTLRRLEAVPAGAENFRWAAGAMSFGDLTRHLVDADVWLARKLREPELPAMQGRAGAGPVGDRAAWRALLNELESCGQRRQELLRTLDGPALERRLPDERFGGEASVWTIVVRGNLEHEAHHRGQIAAALRALGRCERGEE